MVVKQFRQSFSETKNVLSSCSGKNYHFMLSLKPSPHSPLPILPSLWLNKTIIINQSNIVYIRKYIQLTISKTHTKNRNIVLIYQDPQKGRRYIFKLYI